MKYRASIWLLVLILAAPGLASAIKKGRLIGEVIDPDKNPIEGVTVTATSEQVVGGYREIRVTDKKGVFKLDFEEINVVYQYRFDKVGYQTLKAEQTWRKDGSARHEFVMTPGESAPVDDQPPASSQPPAIAAFNTGAAALNAGDSAAAIGHFEKALEIDPELRQAWGALSVAQLNQKDFQAAVEAAEKAIAMGANDELVMRARWEAYRNLGDEAKAAEAQAAVEQAGVLAEEAKKVFNEAVGLVKADDHQGAFAKFKEAAKINPNLEEAVLGMATSGVRIGAWDEARAAAMALLELDPTNEQGLRVRYNAALRLVEKAKTDPDAEKEVFESLVGLAPIEPKVATTGILQLALSAYDDNDMERAKERFGSILEFDSKCVECHYYVGLIGVSEQANDVAKRHFEQFLQLAPEDNRVGEVRDFLAYISSP